VRVAGTVSVGRGAQPGGFGRLTRPGRLALRCRLRLSGRLTRRTRFLEAGSLRRRGCRALVDTLGRREQSLVRVRHAEPVPGRQPNEPS
jgi:hypothetical protein